MIYTPKMREQVRQIPVPHDFVMDVVEYSEFKPPFIALRFYESHWRHFNERERLNCTIYLSTVKKIIESHGVNVTLDPVYDAPGTQVLG